MRKAASARDLIERQAAFHARLLETDRIAKKAAALHGVKKEELLKGRMVSPEEYEYGYTSVSIRIGAIQQPHRKNLMHHPPPFPSADFISILDSVKTCSHYFRRKKGKRKK